MSDDSNSAAKVNRRNLLKMAGAAGAGALPVVGVAAGEEPMQMPGKTAAAAAVPVYGFFNSQEAQFIEAAIDTLIPSDEVGPGARELGVASFIDRQMNSGYGRGDRMYLEGPFAEGTPEQGYQLRMTPAELLRAGIRDVDAYCREKHHKRFQLLESADKVAVLQALEKGTAQLATVPDQVFFNLLYELTVQGYFADPIYGGNLGKASWKMVGFPGVGMMYADKIVEYHNKPYKADPQSIQDLAD